MYLNGWMPQLQTSGALVYFLEQHRGNVMASPVLLGQITQAFVAGVEAYAKTHGIPRVHFGPGQRKDDVAAGYRQQFTGEEGVVFIGVAQEKFQAFKAHKRVRGGTVSFDFSRQAV
jgi:hypothetical protein